MTNEETNAKDKSILLAADNCGRSSNFLAGTCNLHSTSNCWTSYHCGRRFSNFSKMAQKKNSPTIKEAEEEKFPLDSVPKEKLGLWIFLASEILIFGSLIVAYAYVRINSGSWPIATQTHNVLLGMTNTIILLTSSLAMILALYSIRAGNVKGLKIALGSAFALGFAFLSHQTWIRMARPHQQRLHHKQRLTSLHILYVNWSSRCARCSGHGSYWIPHV